MASLSDTLTAVGVVLVLLFGSIALYLYTRVQQTDQKVSLLESIVLDLKLTNEIPLFHDAPASSASSASPASSASSASPASPASSAFASAPVPAVTASVPAALVIEEQPVAEYKPFEPEEELEPLEPLESLESPQPSQQSQSQSQSQSQQQSQQDYEAMSVKELQALARSRGVTVEKGAKKHQLIELLTAPAPAPLPSSLSLEILDA